ncbi:MAG TPA: secretion protein HlyD [Hypericibacter adhaerens]|uniref:secretion protein HlyD n=1 Tax=Hypericibacter adhaerens TaxID=2602016 RepID=UPI002CD8FA37|nr:secretion protein HlyD [Hypericibacter adhaerens]HWA44973.1 secretion protein HlyD [Hypericibacter adhaerens]
MRRLVLLLVLLLLATGGGAYGYFRIYEPAHSDRLELTGNVEVRQVNLAFKVGGRIDRLAVDEGDDVATGTVLATLDKRYFEDAIRGAEAQVAQQQAVVDRLEHGTRPEEIDQAKASVAEREAMVENAQLVYRRQTELREKGVASQQAYDDAAATLRQTQAQLRSAQQALILAQIGPREEDIAEGRASLQAAQATLIQAQRDLEDAQLVAPSQGTILSRAREVGAIIQAGETVYVLSLTSPVWVRSYVSEPDLGRVQPGMKVELSTDTPGTPVYRGTVGFISPTAEFTPKTVETRELRTALVYRLRIVVDNPDGALRQGMPVTIEIPPLPSPAANAGAAASNP